MAESSTITREPEISAREVAAIPPDDVPAIQQALQRAFAAEDVAAKNIALKRASESIGLLSGYAPFPCEALMEGSYSAVFRLIRESLEAGAPGLRAGTKDAIARSGALKVAGRKLAPAAYGDKRQPYHSGACIGIDGMSVNLRFSDNSAEFVFGDEDLELINEEGRDLYIARLPASEILALRQSLIDYLPASETVGAGAAPDLRADREALRKALTEITAAADKMILSLPGHWHDDATIELTDAAGDARTALSAAAQNDLYDVSLDAAPTGSGNASEAARDVIAENADCRRPAVACGAGGTGTGGCGCMLAADAVLRLAAPATEAARG